MTNGRFDRQMRFFGEEGQARLGAARVAVVGIGGLGSLVVQELALLGVGDLALIDSEELAETDRNRNPAARHADPIPRTLKVDIGERMVKAVNPQIHVERIHDSLVSLRAFDAVIRSDYVFGCLDSEGARLVLNELSAAYARPYFDLASDILPGDPPNYGGRVCVAWDGHGCIACFGLLDVEEARLELSGPRAQRDQAALYGVLREALDRTGPSIVSINGVVASLGVSEFMIAVTGVRPPKRVMTYYGHMGRVAGPSREGADPNCYYCRGIRGRGDDADAQRYIRDGVGEFLR